MPTFSTAEWQAIAPLIDLPGRSNIMRLFKTAFSADGHKKILDLQTWRSNTSSPRR